jgi:hypothetical protein
MCLLHLAAATIVAKTHISLGYIGLAVLLDVRALLCGVHHPAGRIAAHLHLCTCTDVKMPCSASQCLFSFNLCALQCMWCLPQAYTGEALKR